jgi:hypothetical protein
MTVRLEQMFVSSSILNELRQEIKRISGSYQECRQENTRHKMDKFREGRYSHWDFPEAPYYDVKMNMK